MVARTRVAGQEEAGWPRLILAGLLVVVGLGFGLSAERDRRRMAGQETATLEPSVAVIGSSAAMLDLTWDATSGDHEKR